jgi:predicted RNase H-like HicB family nuclease
MDLDYPVELVPDGDEWTASNPDLPGCYSFGQDPNSAVENLSKVRSLWIEGELSSGNAIPEPAEDERYSGKFVLRIPRGLHRLADHKARQEGVSLNSLVGSLLSGALGYPGSDKQRYPGLAAYAYCGPWGARNPDPNDAQWHTLPPGFDVACSTISTKDEAGASFAADKNLMSYIHRFAGQLGSRHKSPFLPATNEDYRAKEKHLASK